MTSPDHRDRNFETQVTEGRFLRERMTDASTDPELFEALGVGRVAEGLGIISTRYSLTPTEAVQAAEAGDDDRLEALALTPEQMDYELSRPAGESQSAVAQAYRDLEDVVFQHVNGMGVDSMELKEEAMVVGHLRELTYSELSIVLSSLFEKAKAENSGRDIYAEA